MVFIGRIFQILTHWPIYWFLRLLADYRVEGQENLQGLDRSAVIFAANHVSYLDAPICAVAMPWYGATTKGFYPVRALVVDRFCDLFAPKYFFQAIYVRLNAAFKISRTNGDLGRALFEVVAFLKDDKCAKVCIFPEGRMTRDGRLQEGKRGVAYLQQKTGAPIVPIGINGGFGFMSIKHWRRRGTRVTVRIGKPFFLPEDLSLEEGAALVMARIAELVEYN
jgi:1-acyl-sn-glycerol-3-phosphate acyltransferase